MGISMTGYFRTSKESGLPRVCIMRGSAALVQSAKLHCVARRAQIKALKLHYTLNWITRIGQHPGPSSTYNSHCCQEPKVGAGP